MAQGPDEMTRDTAGSVHLVAGKAPSTTNTEQLRQQIKATRADMSETIDAIQERLSPSNLMTQAKATVKEAAIGRARHLAYRARMVADDLVEQSADTRERAVRMAKANPVSAAVAGVAAGWLLVRALKSHRLETLDEALNDSADHSAPGSNHAGRSKTRLLVAAASAGFACWGAWKARNSSPRSRIVDATMQDDLEREASSIGLERIR